MAGKQQDDIEEATTKDLMAFLADEAKERKQARQVPTSQAKLVTPFYNPNEGPRLKLKWKYVTQNGARCNPDLLTNAEIAVLNKLVPGEYNKKKIQVLKRRDKSIDIRYKNRTLDEKMTLKNYGRTLEELCQQILIEAEDIARRKKSGEFVEDED